MLDGEATEVHGVGFAGVKGFAGGFGRGALGPWGEHAIKAFVQEAVDEALKLESALARLRTQQRVALLHYAPIRATVEGEPPEIFAVSRVEPPRGADQPLSASAPSFTATRIAALRKAAHPPAFRFTTSRCRC